MYFINGRIGSQTPKADGKKMGLVWVSLSCAEIIMLEYLQKTA